MRKPILLLSAFAIAITGLLAGGVPMPAKAAMVDGPDLTWRLSLWGKRRAFTEGLEYMSSEVAKRTGGKFQVKLYYGEQLSKSKENLDGISVGAFEAALFCPSYSPDKVPALSVLDLPFLPLTNLDIMLKANYAVFNHPAAKAALDKWNAMLYVPNVLPQYEYMGRGKPPKSVADFKGMRVRALGGMGRAAEAIGAVPTTVTASETYTALQRGTVDAIGFPFTYTFAAYKLDEIADWYTTNMSLGTVGCPIVFNKDSWAKLPPQYQALLNDLKPDISEAQKKAYAEKDVVNLKKWADNPDLVAVKIADKEMAEFRRIGGEPIWEEWVKENESRFPAQELLNLVLETAKGSM